MRVCPFSSATQGRTAHTRVKNELKVVSIGKFICDGVCAQLSPAKTRSLIVEQRLAADSHPTTRLGGNNEGRLRFSPTMWY